MKTECPICGKMRSTHNMKAHIERVHPPEVEAPKETPLNKWRRRTPIFGPGQVGIRRPNERPT